VRRLSEQISSRLVPAVCDVSVTNVCNATCDFCSYAYNKGMVHDRRWIDATEFGRALPILYRRGIRYVNFQGGEPLLHPDIAELVSRARHEHMRAALITNGWLLPQKIGALADAGLGTLLVSLDSHRLDAHERNRGLRGVGARIREGLALARGFGIPTIASVTVNRLVNYEQLPDLINALGFEAVTFSYPRREPFGSSSLVYSAESTLVDFDVPELLDALASIRALRGRIRVLNPAASLDDIERHMRGEPEVFACVGGHKYFYLDWNLQIWRCEAWDKPLGSVFDFEQIPDQRDRCTACTMSCYRDTSVLMHAGVAVADALASIAGGRPGDALRSVWRKSVLQSLRSVAVDAHEIGRLRGPSRARSGRGEQKAQQPVLVPPPRNSCP